MTKVTKHDQRIWVECAILTGVSALFAVLMNKYFARHKPAELLPKDQSGDILAVALEMPTPEEKAKTEPARRALDQATAQITGHFRPGHLVCFGRLLDDGFDRSINGLLRQ